MFTVIDVATSRLAVSIVGGIATFVLLVLFWFALPVFGRKRCPI